MILHNTTFILSEQDSECFISLIRQEAITALSVCPSVHQPRLFRISTEDPEEPNIIRFALHFYTHTAEEMQEVLSDQYQHLLGELTRTLGQRLLFFSTTMEEVAL